MMLFVPLLIVAYFFNFPIQRKRRSTIKENRVLSQREIELAQLVADGKTNKEIGELLFISENTGKTHIKNILAKLKIKNRTQIAQWYYNHSAHPKE